MQKAEYDKAGNLNASFSSLQKEVSRMDVVFGKKAGFNPIDFRVYVNWPPGSENLMMHTKTEWKRVGELWLPSRIYGSAVSPPLDKRINVNHADIALTWKIGDSALGKQPLIDPDATDWRERIRLLFDEDWQRIGYRPSLLELPPDE